jgi:hypothetical protein
MMVKDFPLDECVAAAKEYVAEGALVFQKWTCDHCGERVTANAPNTFTEMGHHEDCGHWTNIRRKGCNYKLIWSIGG